MGALTTDLSQRWEPWPTVITVKHVKRCYRSSPWAVYLLSLYFGEHLLTQLLHCCIDYASCHLETRHLHPNFLWLGCTLILCYHCHQQCYLTDKRKKNRLWCLFDVFCRVQFARLSWAFSRQRRLSEESRNKLSSGCTHRLLTLTGTQRGEVLNVGHKVVCCVVKLL